MGDTQVDGELLRQARTGSHAAFRALIEPYGHELRRHCYRMTGSVDDADDLVQETLFRAWRGLGAYVSRGSFRAWLYRIATNATLNLLDSAARRREVVNSAAEPAWLQPYPDPEGSPDPADSAERLEQIGLAFVVALQNLPGRQRSALLLCDVLGFSPAEASQVLDCSVPAANSLLQRARTTMSQFHPVDAAVPEGDEQKRLVDRFVHAWRSGDIDALVQLLSDTAHITMPPHPLEWSGAAAVANLLFDIAPDRDPDLIRFIPARANGEYGFATYVPADGPGHFERHCIMFFGDATQTVDKITGFTEDRIFNLLGLPSAVSAR